MSCLEDCEESIRDMTIMFLEETIEHLSEELKERSQRQNIMQMKHNKEIEKMSKRHSREINLITQNHQKVFEKLKQDVKEAEKKSRTKDYSQIGSLMNLVTTQKAYIEKLESELDESNGLLAGMRKLFAETEAEFTSTLLQLQEKLGNADDLVTERRIENEKLIEDVENATKSLELIILSQAEQIKILSESKVQQNDEIAKATASIKVIQKERDEEKARSTSLQQIIVEKDNFLLSVSTERDQQLIAKDDIIELLNKEVMNMKNEINEMVNNHL